ncbi:MAG: hypothetical protein L0191_00525 [Acidobacteria bacterium]|nr:hypothetical protein [Acidobacteriota bacterium]
MAWHPLRKDAVPLARVVLATGLAALGALACRKETPTPRPSLDLSYLPSNALLVAYADTVRLKDSSLYRDWEARAPEGKNHLAEVKTFLGRLGIAPDKDLDGVVVAYLASPGSGGWVALLRGRFDLDRIKEGLEDPSARMSEESYKRWSVYNLVLVPDLGDLSVALVDSSAVALGRSEALRKVLDARDHPEDSLARNALMKQLIPALEPQAQIWALLDGKALWRSQGNRQGGPGGADPQGLGSLSSIASASLSASLSADISLRLDIGSDSPKHAQNLADALKGILGFARLGPGGKDPDIGRLLDAIQVDGTGERIILRANLPGDLAMHLGTKLEATR